MEVFKLAPEPNFFISFDKDTGSVISVGRSHEEHYIQVEKWVAMDFIDGNKNPQEYHVVWKDDKYQLQERAKVSVIDLNAAQNDYYRLPEDESGQIVFTQDKKQNKWTVKIDKSFTNEVTKSPGLFQLFYITPVNNSNIVYGVMRVDFDHFKENDILEIENHADRDVSIFCKNLYKNYSHVRS